MLCVFGGGSSRQGEGPNRLSAKEEFLKKRTKRRGDPTLSLGEDESGVENKGGRE